MKFYAVFRKTYCISSIYHVSKLSVIENVFKSTFKNLQNFYEILLQCEYNKESIIIFGIKFYDVCF